MYIAGSELIDVDKLNLGRNDILLLFIRNPISLSGELQRLPRALQCSLVDSLARVVHILCRGLGGHQVPRQSIQSQSLCHKAHHHYIQLPDYVSLTAAYQKYKPSDSFASIALLCYAITDFVRWRVYAQHKIDESRASVTNG